MKPKYEEVRRMIMLALGCWTDFLNTLNSPLYSKSHLPDNTFLKEVLDGVPFGIPRQEIMEALVLVSMYWDRSSIKEIQSGLIGKKLSKPHLIFSSMLISERFRDENFEYILDSVTRQIDNVDAPILLRGVLDNQPLEFDFDDENSYREIVEDYDQRMLAIKGFPDPVISAGVEMQLIYRGFVI